MRGKRRGKRGGEQRGWWMRERQTSQKITELPVGNILINFYKYFLSPLSGHFNRVTPPNPFKTVPPIRDQAFSYMSLWGQSPSNYHTAPLCKTYMHIFPTPIS